ncbi:MAG: DUF4386 domain-containing protein [Leptospiraceae bacterium]|nr:DUF4386 domain-containing protein [Leptospiraceae bacterium]
MIDSANIEGIPGLQRLARLAGVLYLIIIVCGMFAQGAVRETMLIVGQPEATVRNVLEGAFLFRLGILADLVMIIADVLIGIAFFVILRSVNESLSLLSAFFRLAQATVLGLNLILPWIALQLISASGESGVPGVSVTQNEGNLAYQLLMAHGMGYKIALVFFACSLLVQAYLFFKTDLFPNWLAYLLVVAAAGYLVDTVATVAMADYETYANIFESLVVISALGGELTLCLYLLIRGVSSLSGNLQS